MADPINPIETGVIPPIEPGFVPPIESVVVPSKSPSFAAAFEKEKVFFDGEEVRPSDPPPFDVDRFMAASLASSPVEEVAEKHDSVANVLHELARPWLAQGYNSVAALNRGTAGFYAHLDSVSQFLENRGIGKRGELFEKIAIVAEDNAEYWAQRAEDVGLSFVDEIISEGIGGAVPGITTFALDVASGYTFPAAAGAAEAEAADRNSVAGALLSAAKTGTLHHLFKMMGPLKQYLKAPAMGTVFGIEEMQAAPEGSKTKAFVKGAAIGAGYSLSSPGGQFGLNEIAQGVRSQLPKKGEPATRRPPGVRAPNETVTPGAGKQKQRKFLITAEEAVEIEPELKGKIKEIDPQTYTVVTNKESQAAARTRIETDGIESAREYVLSESFLDVEKSATASELIREYQKRGELDQAAEITESLATQLTRSGQAIQSASQWVSLSPQGFIRWGNRQLDNVRKKYSFLDSAAGRKPGSFELTPEEQLEINDLHRRATLLPDGPDKADLSLQMIDVVARKVPPSMGELFDAYRYQNMLSSPKTQFRNIFENVGNTFITRPLDIVSLGAVDFIKSGLTGKNREAYSRDVLLYQKAAVNSIPNAVNAFKETWRLGTSATIEKPEIGVESRNAFEQLRTKQIPGALTTVSRFMEAADKFNIALISAGEMARLTKQGVSPEQAYQQAQQVGQTYLYRDKLDPADKRLAYPSRALAALGDIAMKSRKAPVIGTVAKWYIPFITTPVNKAIQMIEYSPLTVLRDPRTFKDSEVAARALSGSIVGGVGAAMAYSNDTTWAAPTDAEEKKWFYASGRKPFSVRMGDTFIPVWYLGPHALSFGISMAAKHFFEERPEAMTDEGYEKLGALAEGTAQFIGSQSSTQSIGALFSALQGDIDYNFMSQTGFMVQQAIPASAFIRYVNTIVDPVYRHPRGFTEQIEANLPIISKRLDARLTPFLEESERDPLNYFLPYDIGKADKFYDEMYPIIQTSTRAKYLKNYAKRETEMANGIEGLIGSIKRGDITPEDSIEAFGKIITAAPKITDPLLEGE